MDDLVQIIEKVKVTLTCTCYFGDQRSHSHGYGKPAYDLALITVSQDVLVKEELCHASFRSPQPAQVGYMVT